MLQFHSQGASKQTCTVLAVTSDTRSVEQKQQPLNHRKYPFPELVSSGRLEVYKFHIKYCNVGLEVSVMCY